MKYTQDGVEYSDWDWESKPPLYQRTEDGAIGWFLNGQFIPIDPNGHPKRLMEPSNRRV